MFKESSNVAWDKSGILFALFGLLVVLACSGCATTQKGPSPLDLALQGVPDNQRVTLQSRGGPLQGGCSIQSVDGVSFTGFMNPYGKTSVTLAPGKHTVTIVVVDTPFRTRQLLFEAAPGSRYTACIGKRSRVGRHMGPPQKYWIQDSDGNIVAETNTKSGI